MKFIVLDMQGYIINKRFTAKELAIYDGKHLKSFLFKSPIKYSSLYSADRKTAAYLYNNVHGIPFDSGDVEYEQIEDILQQNLKDIDLVFVKGQAKLEFLKQYLADFIRIFNLENDNTGQVPKLGPSEDNCDNHTFKSCNCSSRNVEVLFEYIYNKLIAS